MRICESGIWKFFSKWMYQQSIKMPHVGERQKKKKKTGGGILVGVMTLFLLVEKVREWRCYSCWWKTAREWRHYSCWWENATEWGHYSCCGRKWLDENTVFVSNDLYPFHPVWEQNNSPQRTSNNIPKISRYIQQYLDLWQQPYLMEASNNRLYPQKTNPINPSNYRPIALTRCFCKTLERMIILRLTWLLESNNLLSNLWTRFRAKRSNIN